MEGKDSLQAPHLPERSMGSRSSQATPPHARAPSSGPSARVAESGVAAGLHRAVDGVLHPSHNPAGAHAACQRHAALVRADQRVCGSGKGATPRVAARPANRHAATQSAPQAGGGLTAELSGVDSGPSSNHRRRRRRRGTGSAFARAADTVLAALQIRVAADSLCRAASVRLISCAVAVDIVQPRGRRLTTLTQMGQQAALSLQNVVLPQGL